MKFILTLLFAKFIAITGLLAQEYDFDCNFSNFKYEINENNRKIKNIQVDNIENMIINDCLLNDIEIKIEKINYCISTNQNYKKQIDNDLLSDYENLVLQSYHKRNLINSYLTYADYWLYSRALFFYSIYDTTNYLKLIENSLMINPKYIPSLYEKSKWLLNHNRITEGIEIIKSIKSFYQKNNEISMLNLIIDLYSNKLFEKGMSYFNSGYFNESLMYFEFLDTVCMFYPNNNCEISRKFINLSKNGILNSYLSVAEQALKAGKYTIAESFISKAEDYIALKMKEYQEKTTIIEKYKLISQKYLQLSAYYKKNNEISNSQYYMDNANRLCRKIYGTDCTTNTLHVDDTSLVVVINNDTTKQITPQYNNTSEPQLLTYANKYTKKSIQSTSKTTINKNYQNIIQKANEAFDNAEYEKALQLYESVKQQTQYRKDTEEKQLNNYIQQAAIQVILSKINNADFYIWTNKLSIADSILDFCDNIKTKYSITNNSQLDITLLNFKNKIVEKRCKNIEDEIETNIKIIESKVKNREFDDILTYSNRVDTLKTKTNCLPLLIKPYTTNTEAVLNFLKYRFLAKGSFNDAEYSKFAEYYLISDNIFDVSNLENFVNTKIDILSFIDYNYNFEAAVSIFKIALKNKMFELGFNILNIIKNKETSNYITKDMQIELANTLMEHQKIKLITERIEILINEASKDKWFIFFNKKYKSKK